MVREQSSRWPLAAVVAVALAGILLVSGAVHSRPRYYAQYGLRYLWGYRQVTMDKMPRDCEWLTSPLGSKKCHYKAEAESTYIGKDDITGETVDYLGGPDLPSNWHKDHSHTYYPIVRVHWQKLED